MRSKKCEINLSHPKDKSNFLTHFLFCWQIPIVVKLWKKQISDENYTTIIKTQESHLLGAKLEKYWDQELKCKKPSLKRALLKAFGFEIFLYTLIYLPFDLVSTFLQPFYLGKLLDYFTLQEKPVDKTDACVYGFLVVLSAVIRVLSSNIFGLEMFACGLKMQTACSALIYQKILKSTRDNIQKQTLGKIVNLLSSDTDRFNRSLYFVQYVWISIVKVIVLLYFLIIWFDFKGLVGVGPLVVFILAQYFFIRIVVTYRQLSSQNTDFRLHTMNDVISGIQTIKMFAWEDSFAEIISLIRKKELKYVTISNQCQATISVCSSYMNKMSVYFYILMLILTQTLITPQLVFMSINVFDLIKTSLQITAAGTSNLAELKISVRRIESFLLNISETTNNQLKTTFSNYKLKAENVVAQWVQTSPQLTLDNINFDVNSGEFVAIIGSAGSGKSSFFQVILKELNLISGSISINGRLSYAPQEPWVFPATIKENILFGEKLEMTKYRRILHVCALEHDISLYPYGDNTLVGERGVMLSGGQKARVSLARAIYRDADIYLLDNPLAAVDAHVANQIFTNCFLDYLKQKTVILITHQIQFLKYIDRIYILENGRITTCGSYDTLPEGSIIKYQNNTNLTETQLNSYSHQNEIKEDGGSSSMNRYKCYLEATGSYFRLIFQLVLFVISQVFIICLDSFLSFWVNLKHDSFGLSPKVLHFLTDINCLYVYSAIGVAVIVFNHLCVIHFIIMGKKASNKLHNSLLSNTLEASMKFFNNHPSGRILNRFSRDLGIIDDNVPRIIFVVIRQNFALLGSCLVVVIVNYWIIIPTLLLYAFFYCCYKIFTPALDYFKKLSATRKSPIFTHTSATLQGLSIIKAMQKEKEALKQFYHYQNLCNSVEYLQKSLYFCFSYWIDFACTLYTAAIIFYILLFKDDSLVGNVGLSITQSLLLIGTAQLSMRNFIDLDSLMVCVERVAKYEDLILEDSTGVINPSKTWPVGHILFSSVFLKYSPNSAYALKQINLEIKSGEKIGIVGRTGSGKSSLISALFRLYDFEGTILIDGVDTKTVSLKTLRTRITVIPQDPVFFFGSLRKNLDPFNEFSDNDLWRVLDETNLKIVVANLPNGLDSDVFEGGGNFSVGQRQMLCLVRAVLKKTKIVILDEATANVDLDTDRLIQTTIRKMFKESTVLTVAHRIDTIIDCDKILVMSEGSVVEFDKKDKLLNNTNSYFYKHFYSCK